MKNTYLSEHQMFVVVDTVSHERLFTVIALGVINATTLNGSLDLGLPLRRC